jgi:hypothetical protein
MKTFNCEMTYSKQKPRQKQITTIYLLFNLMSTARKHRFIQLFM